MYFEDLSMRGSINCASAHQNGGFRSSEKTEPKSAVCVFMISRTNLFAFLVKGIKINVHSIIAFVLVLELRVNIAFVN